MIRKKPDDSLNSLETWPTPSSYIIKAVVIAGFMRSSIPLENGGGFN
jgi:hypothetical protein